MSVIEPSRTSKSVSCGQRPSRLNEYPDQDKIPVTEPTLTLEQTNKDEGESRINSFYPQVSQTYGGGISLFPSKIVQGDV